MKSNQIGIVDKIRVIKTFPDMLVRFTLQTSKEQVNCIVCKKELANQLLFLEDGQTEIACFGHFNKKQQLIVDKMTIRHPSSFVKTFSMAR